MGNLHEMSLAEACERFRQRVAKYLADKQDKISNAAVYRAGSFSVLVLSEISRQDLMAQ